jgi:hypothetical protein
VIPNVTTDVGRMIKDKVDKVLDDNPKVKDAIDVTSKVTP